MISKPFAVVERISAPDKIRVVPGRISAAQFPSVFLTAGADKHEAKIVLSKVQVCTLTSATRMSRLPLICGLIVYFWFLFKSAHMHIT